MKNSMRYVFIIQGEGRGHLTQAMTMERLLLAAGHEVPLMLVGKSPARKLPAFFSEGVKAEVQQFESVNFVPSSNNRKPDYAKTGLYNFFNLSAYLPSVRTIVKRLKDIRPDVVVNFYDLIGTNAFNLSRVDAPLVCVGHQFLFTHKGFSFPAFGYEGHVALNMLSEAVAFRSSRLLALSFRKMPDEGKLHVVPPLLRSEVLELHPQPGDYIHGYLLNAGFSKDVMEWHARHPETPLHFFWDRADEAPVKVIDDTLSFHYLNDHEFLEKMAGCRAYASTAGFESICEAMYLGKPLLMVPSHIEQKCNAYDACECWPDKTRPACTADRFDLDLLLRFTENGFVPASDFPDWVRSASPIFLKELTEF